MKKAPATTAKRLNSQRQYRALSELLKGPQTVRQLFDSTGANGVPQLIASLRGKGLKISTSDRQGCDRDGKPVTYCVYILHFESHRYAFKLLADFAG